MKTSESAPERIWAIDGEDGKRWTPTRPAYDYMTEYVRADLATPAPQPALDAGETYQCDACGKKISEEDRRGGIRAGGEGTFCPKCCGEKPAQDAGEWRYEAQSIHGWRILRANGDEVVRDVYREEDAVQIVSDHRSAAAVPKLVAALNDLLDKFYPHLCKPTGKNCVRCKALVRGNAALREVEALTTVNQTGGEQPK